MWVLLEACLCGVACYLVVEEEAPVVAVGHGEFAVSECEPVEYAVLNLLVVVHESVCLPFLLAMQSCLEHLEGKGCLSEFLHDDVLVGGVEEVVILERVVVVEVLSAVEVGYGLVVIPWVDDGGVVGVGWV